MHREQEIESANDLLPRKVMNPLQEYPSCKTSLTLSTSDVLGMYLPLHIDILLPCPARLTVESALCIRAAKNTDYNALDILKKTGTGVLHTLSHTDVGAARSSTPDSLRSPSPPAPSYPNAVISFTVYNRIPYLPSCLTRSSQHAVLSSQTLDDLLRAIPCASNNMPTEELDAAGDVSGYTLDDQGRDQHSGCLFYIEGLVYGDGRENIDYSE